MLHWLLPAVLPALLALALVYVSDKRREPWWLVTLTFVFGIATMTGATYAQDRAAAWTGLDLRADVSGNAGALLFVFAFVAPVREAAKVMAMWPAFRSKHFDEPLDGITYAAAAALGGTCVQNARIFHEHPLSGIWIARAVLSLFANVFFACVWGYALGRVKRKKQPGPLFPISWTLATIAHGLYIHLVHGRGPAAIVGVVPLVLAMLLLTYFAWRDLRSRGDAREGRASGLLERASLQYLTAPPSLRSVREAMRKEGQPITLRWIVFGTFVTVGAMVVGVGAAIAFGHFAHVDFSRVDEHDVTTTGPVALLGSGLLAAFPLSGYLIAKASSLPTLLEPALATALALVATMALLGAAAPVALVFAAAFSPIALGLAVAGAWVGRP